MASEKNITLRVELNLSTFNKLVTGLVSALKSCDIPIDLRTAGRVARAILNEFAKDAPVEKLHEG